MPDQNHTDIQVKIAEMAATMTFNYETTKEILTRVKEQNGRVYECEKDIALNEQKIETNKEKIGAQGKRIKSNTWRIGLLVGAIMGIEKLVTRLVG